jgi:lysophospholipase L1-like esterase
MILGLTLIAGLLMEGILQVGFAFKDWLRPLPIVDPRLLQSGYAGASWPIQHQRELEQLDARWEPFVYFRQRAFAGQTITIDDRGRRQIWSSAGSPRESTDDPRGGSATETEALKKPRLLLLGGSALWGFGARDEFTIPSLLAKELHARGIDVEIDNLAEIGYVNTQEIIALQRQIEAGEQPDLVVFYDGVNDTTSALLEGEAGVSTNEVNRRHEFNIRQSPLRLTGALIRKLVHDSASFRLADALGQRLTGHSAAIRVESSAGRIETLAEDVVRRYIANLRLVEGLGRSHGFRAWFFWQPVVFDKQPRTTFEQDELAKLAWAEPMFNRVYSKVRGSNELENNRAFLDLSKIFHDDPETRFIDYCHTTETANAQLAASMAEVLLPALQELGTLPIAPP